MKRGTKNLINLLFDVALTIMITCNLFKYCSDSIKQLSQGIYTEHAFSYYTTLSNLFVVVASIIKIVAIVVLILRSKDEIPTWISYVKAISTITVALTMFIIIFAFVGEENPNVAEFFLGREMISHVIAPTIAITQFIFFGGEVKGWKVAVITLIISSVYMVYYTTNTYITDTWGKDLYKIWRYGFWTGIIVIFFMACVIIDLGILICSLHKKFTKKYRKYSNEGQKWLN